MRVSYTRVDMIIMVKCKVRAKVAHEHTHNNTNTDAVAFINANERILALWSGFFMRYGYFNFRMCISVSSKGVFWYTFTFHTSDGRGDVDVFLR